MMMAREGKSIAWRRSSLDFILALSLAFCLASSATSYNLRAFHSQNSPDGEIVFGDFFEKAPAGDQQHDGHPSSAEDFWDYPADSPAEPPTDPEASWAWQRLDPSLLCGPAHMQLYARGPGAAQMELVPDPRSSAPVYTEPSASGGPGVARSAQHLVMAVPLDGCETTQGGDQVMPMLWKGIPIMLVCPRRQPQSAPGEQPGVKPRAPAPRRPATAEPPKAQAPPPDYRRFIDYYISQLKNAGQPPGTTAPKQPNPAEQPPKKRPASQPQEAPTDAPPMQVPADRQREGNAYREQAAPPPPTPARRLGAVPTKASEAGVTRPKLDYQRLLKYYPSMLKIPGVHRPDAAPARNTQLTATQTMMSSASQRPAGDPESADQSRQPPTVTAQPGRHPAAVTAAADPGPVDPSLSNPPPYGAYPQWAHQTLYPFYFHHPGPLPPQAPPVEPARRTPDADGAPPSPQNAPDWSSLYGYPPWFHQSPYPPQYYYAGPEPLQPYPYAQHTPPHPGYPHPLPDVGPPPPAWEWDRGRTVDPSR